MVHFAGLGLLKFTILFDYKFKGVSDADICPFCYSRNIIKTDIQKPENSNIFAKNAIADF
jgi:hypothetical protein